MLFINVNRVNRQLHKDFSNVAYGAGNLPEIISTFWYLVGHYPIKEVYIGISPEIYNLHNSRNRVEGVTHIFNNSLLYYSNFNVLQASFFTVKSILFPKNVNAAENPLSKSKVWNYVLKWKTDRYLRNYNYPETYYQELKNIGEYCKANQIRLTFVIPPLHQDFQHIIDSMKLTRYQNKMVSDLKSISEVYNFNFRNDITVDSSRFKDPVHVTDTIYKIVIEPLLFQTGNPDIQISKYVLH